MMKVLIHKALRELGAVDQLVNVLRAHHVKEKSLLRGKWTRCLGQGSGELELAISETEAMGSVAKGLPGKFTRGVSKEALAEVALALVKHEEALWRLMRRVGALINELLLTELGI